MKSGKNAPSENPVNAIPAMPPQPKIEAFRGVHFCGMESMLAGFLRKQKIKDFENYLSPNFVLVLILAGRGTYIDSRQRQYPLTAGSLFFRIPGLRHSNLVEPDSGYLECYLAIGPLLFQALNAMQQFNLTLPVRQIAPEKLSICANKIWQICHLLDRSDSSSLAACTAEVIAAVDLLLKSSSAAAPEAEYHDLILLACRELESDFRKKFSLQKFCRKHSIGYESFRKQFRSQTGCSPWHYRIRSKITAAEILLQDNNLAINEISELLGYNNLYEFSAQFKRWKNCPPSAFRKKQ